MKTAVSEMASWIDLCGTVPKMVGEAKAMSGIRASSKKKVCDHSFAVEQPKKGVCGGCIKPLSISAVGH